MYSTYPDIILKIKKTLKKINVTPSGEPPEIFVEKKLRFYHTLCETKNGEKVFFKSLLKKEKDIKNRFSNEINFLKALKEKPEYPLSKFAPRVLNFSLGPDFFYLLYKFLPGKSRGRKDKFSQKEIKKIVKLIKTINSSKKIFKLVPKKSFFNFLFYQKEINSFFKKIKISIKTEEKIKKFIKKNEKVFYQARPALTHGDFSEANLIFYKGKIKIIDWEHIQLRNPLYDFVGFWLKRKNHPKEQKILKDEYFKKGKSKILAVLFKLALIEICLRDLMFFEEMLEILKTFKENTKIKEAKVARKKEIKETLNLLEKEFA